MSILAHVTRSGLVESRHQGYIVVCDPHGQVVLSSGPAELDELAFYRSAAKPMQAIPLIETGTADHYNLTDEEIAIACGSHGGQVEHTRVVAGMLAKGDLSLDQLLCGKHPPYYEPAAAELIRTGQPFTNLHSNCSGKHAGMLLVCRHMGWPTEGYNLPDHPLQKYILEVMADFTGVPANLIVQGVDGCTVVCFGVKVSAMATSFARLARSAYFEEQGNPARAAAVRRITTAMYSFPLMVGGTGRNDTDLMTVAEGRVFSKVGAEALWCIGFKEVGLGLALKIEDGANRAEPAIFTEILRQTKLLPDEVIARFAQLQLKPITNMRGQEVGLIEPVFHLTQPE